MGYIYDTNEIINFFLYNTEVYTHENYVDICIPPIECPMLLHSNRHDYNLIIRKRKNFEICYLKRLNYIYFFGIIRNYLIEKNKELKQNILLLKNKINGLDDNICSTIYKYIRIRKRNFGYKDFINKYKLYENSEHKTKIYRHLTFDKRYEIISLILLNITVKDNKIDSRICNNFIQDCKFSNNNNRGSLIENQVSMRLRPLEIINYLKEINKFYNIEESSKVFLLQCIILNNYLN